MPRPLGYALRAWNKLFGILTGAAGGDIEAGPPVGANPAPVTTARFGLASRRE
jgi:hypothetical protein